MNGNLQSQINFNLLNHFYFNNLTNEHLAYLEKIDKSNDSLNFYYTKYYISVKLDTFVYKYSIKTKDYFYNDTNFTCQLSKYWLKKSSHPFAKIWFDSTLTNPKCLCDKEIQIAFKRAFSKQITNDTLKMDNYKISYYELKKYKQKKKPLIAATLSAIVPGLGKWYIGKPRAFIFNLLANGAYVAQSVESIKKVGIKNAYTIFIISFGSVFYLSNVYGTYNDAKIKLKEKKLIYLNEANTFYNDYFNFNLY